MQKHQSLFLMKTETSVILQALTLWHVQSHPTWKSTLGLYSGDLTVTNMLGPNQGLTAANIFLL